VMKAINDAKASKTTLDRLGHAMLNMLTFVPPSTKSSCGASGRRERRCRITRPQATRGL
jgi:hypothetical protein